jgi:hypothetical protein
MRSNISRCNICGEFFNSKKQLRDHKDKNHRITDSKMMASAVGITNQTVNGDRNNKNN